MVGVYRIRSHRHKDTQNAAEHVGNGPPGIVGKVRVDLGNDGADEGNNPSNLAGNRVSGKQMSLLNVYKLQRTTAMDIVASANGSPMMLPRSKRRLRPPYVSRRLASILFRDGEVAELYAGIDYEIRSVRENRVY